MLNVVKKTGEIYKSKELVLTLVGKPNAIITSHKTDDEIYFGSGKDKDQGYWRALLRQILVAGYLKKDIETYGVVKITEAGESYLNNAVSFMMTEDHTFEGREDVVDRGAVTGGGADAKLIAMLKDLRKKVGKKKGVPPYVVFQDMSLEDMAIKYPTTFDEMANVFGVGEGKAKKYGKEFIDLITVYVAENDIFKPDELVVKSTGTNSALKLYIIQNVDRKLPLDDIASAKGLDMSDFVKEMEVIVNSGTKLNINYWIEDILDEDQQEELYDYFLEAETDSIEAALEEFDGDYDEEELKLYRIKFLSEVAN